MAFRNLVLDKKEGIATLTINRPPLNVIDYDTLVELNIALEQMANDDEVKVVLLRGSGTKAFSAGVEVKDHIGEQMPKMMKEFARIFHLLRGLGKPSIAVVNGVALGGGCELVAGCDMAIASEKALLGQPEIKLGGLAPAAAPLFPRIMGEKKAFELLVMGENISAREAERIGLVNKVVPEEELDKTAEEWARKFLEKSALSVRLVRGALYDCAETPSLTVSLEKGLEHGIRSWQTKDGQEGLKAFLEKRKPQWKNR
ncbi:MAG: enoyl-CoA hydratase/isomerase family protein [Dehalococcoidia bacterium]